MPVVIAPLAIRYLKLGIDFPLDNRVFSKSPSLRPDLPMGRNVPEFGSSIVADLHLRELPTDKLLAFRNLSSAETGGLSIDAAYQIDNKRFFLQILIYIYIYIYILFAI